MSKSIPQSSIDFGCATPADGPVPTFNSNDEETEFRDTHVLTYLIKEDAERIELVLELELRRGNLEEPDAIPEDP